MAPKNMRSYLILGTHECYLVQQNEKKKGYCRCDGVMTWIIQVDPKCNHMYPCKWELEGDYTTSE